MKQHEKLDLILKALYHYKHDGKFYSLISLCNTNDIPIVNEAELKMLAHRLKEDGYINASFTKGDTRVSLTTHGIDYCENNSYTYNGKSLINNNYNLTISNSPNANIVSGSTNVSIQITNYSEIKNKINEIKEAIQNSKELTQDNRQDLVECLDEVETNINAGKKPKFSFKTLLELGSNFSSISSLLVDLGQLLF